MKKIILILIALIGLALCGLNGCATSQGHLSDTSQQSSGKAVIDNGQPIAKNVLITTSNHCKYLFLDDLFFWDKQNKGYTFEPANILSSKWIGECDENALITGR